MKYSEDEKTRPGTNIGVGGFTLSSDKTIPAFAVLYPDFPAAVDGFSFAAVVFGDGGGGDFSRLGNAELVQAWNKPLVIGGKKNGGAFAHQRHDGG